MRLISWLCETISNCNYQKPGCSIISHSLAEHKQKFIVTLYFFCHYVCVTPSSLTTETQQNADAFKFHCTDIDLVTSNHFQSLSRWREVKFEKKKKKRGSRPWAAKRPVPSTELWICGFSALAYPLKRKSKPKKFWSGQGYVPFSHNLLLLMACAWLRWETHRRRWHGPHGSSLTAEDVHDNLQWKASFPWA